jgi:NADPH-dependent 2,4-dienoyl-CoA reductase/sulfur reductase-like enzyme/nitrite reductase/ring-hydroxylating ferredoxin subunit
MLFSRIGAREHHRPGSLLHDAFALRARRVQADGNGSRIAHMGEHDTTAGPDFAAGVALADIPAGSLLAGHVGEDAVMLAHTSDGRLFAVDGHCTHYGAPLAEGLLLDGCSVRCPWHHACVDLASGAALAAPAFAPLGRWQVEHEGGRVFVRTRLAAGGAVRAATAKAVLRIVIVGGGAAGFAAAERLRERGYDGTLTMLSADTAPPCDRPNLSKDYLAGTAPEDWIPLRPEAYYRDHGIDLVLDCEVSAIDVGAHTVSRSDGTTHPFDALLLATGAEPVAGSFPGSTQDNVFVLRSLADARAIIAATADARSVVLLGSGFIGMEAAAALATRGLEVHVVTRDALPFARVLGNALGGFLTGLHREHGVGFHLGRTAQRLDGKRLTLDDGSTVPADLVIVAFGVRPRTGLAERAGLACDDGILVDAQLRTSAPGVFAAGDVARFRRGERDLRIEHWVVAERQGQTAAENLVGGERRFDDVPFFWTSHYGVEIRYVGHADRADTVAVDGDPGQHDCIVRFFGNGRLEAAATLGRDLENLELGETLRAGD